MSTALGKIFVVLVLILIGGFFAAAEIALIAVRRGRLKQLAEEGDKKAKLALELANAPNRFLPTVQFGITLATVFSAAFGGEQLVHELTAGVSEWNIPLVSRHAHLVAFVLITTGITVCQVLFAELVPKRYALRHANWLARYVALPMHWLAIAGRPFVVCMGWATDKLLYLLGSRQGHDETSVSVEDIEHLIETGTAHGVLDPAEQQLALEALRLGERSVRDIMRPRIDMDALDADTPPREVLGAVAMSGFSRVPVYDGDLDHILGFIYIKDVLRRHYLGVPIELRKILHPAVFVPETLPVDRLLAMLQKNHTQMAIVLDEFGGTEGLVTLEDVVEELVGEIRDEHRRDDQQALARRDDGSWLVDGQVAIEDLCEKLHIKDFESDGPRRFRTVAGLILTEVGDIPRVGQVLEWRGLRLEVVDMDGTRIDRVLISLPSVEKSPSSANDEPS